MITVAAEIGMAHDGDWTRVAEYARVAQRCDVDALKLQCHVPEESSEDEPWRVDPGTGETRLQYWTRTAWDVATWRQVGQVIHAHGLQFGCSVFCLEAVALLRQVPELDVWKVPSGVSEWEALVDMVEADSRPVWGSAGLSGPGVYADWWQNRYVLPMNCTSLYPCPPEHSGLGWARRWYGRPGGCAWGWSDHTGDSALIYAAVGAGATVVEVHLELGHEATPDTSASWSPAKLTDLVQGIRRIEQGLASTDKDQIAAAVVHLRPYYVPTRFNGRVAKWGGKGEAI